MSFREGGKRKIHILIISQYFHPEPFRINDIASEWVKRGHKVSVLTGIPNYPQGRFYKGYGLRKRRKELWKGIEITRIPLIPRGRTSAGMVANYLSFMLSGLLWVQTHKISADLIFSFETSPMTQVMTGCRARNKNRIPHFLYVQDLWPENVETVTGIHSALIIKPIHKMVDYIYRNTDRIFATSPSFVEAIVNRRVRVPRRKVHYWPQYAEDIYRPMDRAAVRRDAIGDKASPVHLIPDDDSFKIIFTGNIGTAQGLEILPKTAKLLKKQQIAGGRKIRFVIVGDGRQKDRFIREIGKYGVEDCFTLIPPRDAKEIPKLLACCDAGFISFMDNDLFRRTIPAKLQSYMACGIPVIAAAEGETERILLEADCGLCCKTGDVTGLYQMILKASDMDANTWRQKGRNAVNYARLHFEKKKLMDAVGRHIEGLLEKSGSNG